MLDRRSGAMVLLTTRGGGDVDEKQIRAGAVDAADSRRVFAQRSADHGRSWSRPREITAEVKLPDWRRYATGSGHGLRQVAPASSLSSRWFPRSRSSVPPSSMCGRGGHRTVRSFGEISSRAGWRSDPRSAVLTLHTYPRRNYVMIPRRPSGQFLERV
jgi:sialidase-1